MALSAQVLGLVLMLASNAPGKDACALLTAAEIKAFAGAAVGKGEATVVPAVGGSTCRYEWGPRTPKSGPYYLTITVSEGAKMWPNTPPATVKQAMISAATHDARSNSGVIAGLGDAGTFKSTRPDRISTTAYLKGLILDVSYEAFGTDARSRKDQVIGLLKAAAKRL